MRRCSRNAADLGDVRLHDVDCAARQPGDEGLAPRQHLAAGDRHRRAAAQLPVVVDRVGPDRLLEPSDGKILQHLGGALRPFEAVRPERVARARIDEQLGGISRRLARRAHDRLVEPDVERAAERSPSDLERREAARAILRDDIEHRLRLFHQQRAIGLHAPAQAAAEQAADAQSGRLAQNVPQRDVDAADRVGQRAAAPHPERVLMQLLAHALRRQRVLVAIERLEHLQPGLDQAPVGEHAAVAGQPLIGMDRDDRVDRVLRPDLGRPAALGAFAEQRRGLDPLDAKGRQPRLAR